MKDECHHLKHIQKRVLRSARRKNFDQISKESFSTGNSNSNKVAQVEVYDEVIPSDQQVARVPTRNTYH
ncbi:MAG: hypothetical protein AAGG81_02545 [Chlamydiota bacterium]